METQSEPALGKRNFDDESTTYGSEDLATLGSQTGSLAGDRKARSVKGVSSCRSRVTVVCGECKRLKLKCDRKAPCGSCSKRDTVDRCIYSAAAQEKLDIQSVNNRLLLVEETLRSNNLNNAADITVSDRAQGIAASSSLEPQLTHKARSYLAVNNSGASVAVNLDGVTGIWLRLLGLAPPTPGAPSQGGLGTLSSLLPVSGIREEGVVDFLTEFVKKFRVPTQPSEECVDEDEVLGYVGVTPDLVLSSIPPPDVRAQIYPFFEAAHVMAPCVNFFVFKKRIDDMYLWATTKGVENDEPDPIRPTVNFFAAAALAMAIGIECMSLEREAKPASSSSVGSSPREGPASSAATGDRSMGPPPVPVPSFSLDSSPIFPLQASDLFRLSKLALALSLERIGYDALDLDYAHAKTLQVRYLMVSHHGLENGTGFRMGMSIRERKIVQKRGKGRARSDKNAKQQDTIMKDATGTNPSMPPRSGKGRGPQLALAPEIAGIMGDMVFTARLMGLNLDPDSLGGERLSLYDKEMRRRMWWEIVGLDTLWAECTGEDPQLDITNASTKLPADVDEEIFSQDPNNLPASNIASIHGNIEYFIQCAKLVQLHRKWKQKLTIYRSYRSLYDSRDSLSSRDLIEHMATEFAHFNRELPDHLSLEIPALESATSFAEFKGMSPPKRASVPVGDRGTPAQYDPPSLISMRCELAIASQHAYITLCLPFIQDTGEDVRPGKVQWMDTIPTGLTSAQYLMPSARSIVRVWQYMHSIYRYIRTSLFDCYYRTKQLFDAAVILANCFIENPDVCSMALTSMRVAADILHDPAVLAARHTSGESNNWPNEAVRIIEELILKAESVGARTTGMSTKRKHEEVDGSANDYMYQFRFPFVGPDVVSAGPSNFPHTPISTPGSSLTDVPNAQVPPQPRPQETSHRHHSRTSPVDRGARTGDARPPQVKAKHSEVTIKSRLKNRDASTRARANSTASIRTEGRVMPPPPAPLHLPPPPTSLSIQQQRSPTDLSAGSGSVRTPFSAPLSPLKSGSLHPPHSGFGMGPSHENSPPVDFSGQSSGPMLHGDGAGGSGGDNSGFPRPPPGTFANSSPFTHAPLQIGGNRNAYEAFGPQAASGSTPTHEGLPFGPSGMDYSMNLQPNSDVYENMLPHTAGTTHPDQHRFGREPSEGHHDANRGVLEGPSPFHHGHAPQPNHDPQLSNPHPGHGLPPPLDNNAPPNWGGPPAVYSNEWGQGPYYHQ